MRKFAFATALLGAVLFMSAHAQSMSAAQAMSEGRAAGAAGKAAAGGTVSTSSGQANVPKFNTNAPEAGFYSGGKGQLGSAGTNKQADCRSQVAGNGFDQQECDVVNFLSRNPSTRPKVSLSKTDPIIAASDVVMRNATTTANSSGQVCRSITQANPGEFITETCTTAHQTLFGSCNQKLNIRIDWSYLCPAYTIRGPEIMPGTGGAPAQGEGTIPPDAICQVREPYVELICKEGTTYDPESGNCEWVNGYKDYETIATKIPTVVDVWDNGCADADEKSRLDRKPHVECEETRPKICTQGPQVRFFDGVPISRDCWGWEGNHACLAFSNDKGCGPRANSKCTPNGTTCLEYGADGKCSINEERFTCEKTPPSVTSREVCEDASMCQDGKCFSTDREPDRDFLQAVTSMEAARQAGVYGVRDGQLELFKGFSEECSIKVIGGTVLKSCCGSSGGGGAYKNSVFMSVGSTVAGGVVKEGGKEALKLGSQYMYDALYTSVDSTVFSQGLGAMNGWASGLGDGVFNPSFGFYGFQFSFSFANGFQFVAFDPWSFALSIAIMVITEWLSCEPEEQTMSLKRGQNLCVHLGTRCSKKMKIIGTCLEKKETHCCFNSILAKLVNRQGRAQLGLPMDSCGGFNEEKFKSLDISKMDLSEFIQTIVPAQLDLQKTIGKSNKSVQDQIKNYYDNE